MVTVGPAPRTVSTEDGGTIGYDELVCATEGDPRHLTFAGHDLIGVHEVGNPSGRQPIDRHVRSISAMLTINIPCGQSRADVGDH